MLYPMELKLMELVWDNAPLTAAHLARLSATAIGWKRTTCYTVLARLCQRGCIERRGALVTPILTRARAEEEALADLLSAYFGGERERLLVALERVAPVQAEPKRFVSAEDPFDKNIKR